MRTVVIVDDHAMFRAGVRGEIAGHVEIVAEAPDVPTAVEAILRRRDGGVRLEVAVAETAGREGAEPTPDSPPRECTEMLTTAGLTKSKACATTSE